MHILFSFFSSDCTDAEESANEINVISEVAVKAAIDFTQLFRQQTAFIAGRGVLTEELQKFVSSK